jgi:type I restriction enzyme M protein
VPEGVLFGSTGAHKELRRQLIENNRVEAVLSLPGGVFQPYAGVKTSVLFFRKGGSTERVLFLHADNDGYKLDANHDTPIEADDLPRLARRSSRAMHALEEWNRRAASADFCEKWWFADAATLRANDFNLSAGRYRPMSQSRSSTATRGNCWMNWRRSRRRLSRKWRRCRRSWRSRLHEDGSPW